MSFRVHFPLAIALLLAVSGCANSGFTSAPSGPVFASTPPQENQQSVAALPALPQAATTEVSVSAVDSQLQEFVDPAALAKMSDKDKQEASSAQYFAMQTGRPGAPRHWSGDSGANGSVTVGPFVRVNERDCREFEHTVTIGGTNYTKSGTSCRENGNWVVAQS